MEMISLTVLEFCPKFDPANYQFDYQLFFRLLYKSQVINAEIITLSFRIGEIKRSEKREIGECLFTECGELCDR